MGKALLVFIVGIAACNLPDPATSVVEQNPHAQFMQQLEQNEYSAARKRLEEGDYDAYTLDSLATILATHRDDFLESATGDSLIRAYQSLRRKYVGGQLQSLGEGLGIAKFAPANRKQEYFVSVLISIYTKADYTLVMRIADLEIDADQYSIWVDSVLYEEDPGAEVLCSAEEVAYRILSYGDRQVMKGIPEQACMAERFIEISEILSDADVNLGDL